MQFWVDDFPKGGIWTCSLEGWHVMTLNYLKNIYNPGKLTWNLRITHSEKEKTSSKPSFFGFPCWNFGGVRWCNLIGLAAFPCYSLGIAYGWHRCPHPASRCLSYKEAGCLWMCVCVCPVVFNGLTGGNEGYTILGTYVWKVFNMPFLGVFLYWN